jgi:hypothetical protein
VVSHLPRFTRAWLNRGGLHQHWAVLLNANGVKARVRLHLRTKSYRSVIQSIRSQHIHPCRHNDRGINYEPALFWRGHKRTVVFEV